MREGARDTKEEKGGCTWWGWDGLFTITGHFFRELCVYNATSVIFNILGNKREYFLFSPVVERTLVSF